MPSSLLAQNLYRKHSVDRVKREIILLPLGFYNDVFYPGSCAQLAGRHSPLHAARLCGRDSSERRALDYQINEGFGKPYALRHDLFG